MTPQQRRLKELEAELHERGVVDVKFHFSEDVKTKGTTVVAEDVIAFIEAILAGKGTPFYGMGDSPDPVRREQVELRKKKYALEVELGIRSMYWTYADGLPADSVEVLRGQVQILEDMRDGKLDMEVVADINA